MNKILIANGLLLLSLMGLQQFWICTQCGAPHISETEVASIFVCVSLLIPALLFINQRLNKKPLKAEIVSLMLINPVLFGFVGHSYAMLPYDWSWGNLAGPNRVDITQYRAPGIYCGLGTVALSDVRSIIQENSKTALNKR